MAEIEDSVTARQTGSEADSAEQQVLAAVGAPAFLLPWLDRFYSATDMELVRLAAGEPSSLAKIDPARLADAVGRAVLDVDEAGSYMPSSFVDRLDLWAMFEGWGDVPGPVRARLADWAIDEYAESLRADFAPIVAGQPDASRESDYTYLLLEEAEELIAAQPHVYLWPCDCRAIVGACDRPIHVCLRPDNARGRGREITKDEAVRILHEADAAGLTRTSYLRSKPGEAAICNCCTDCCFPHRAARILDAEAVWPHRRHLAVVDAAECTACGLCEERCPFAAIAVQGTGSGEEVATVAAAECRGCGLCATDCPAEAIAMEPLAGGRERA